MIMGIGTSGGRHPNASSGLCNNPDMLLFPRCRHQKIQVTISDLDKLKAVLWYILGALEMNIPISLRDDENSIEGTSYARALLNYNCTTSWYEYPEDLKQARLLSMWA